jgi:hypothetical protein
MPFATEKRIFVSALSSIMNRRLVWQKAMRIEQDLPAYNQCWAKLLRLLTVNLLSYFVKIKY